MTTINKPAILAVLKRISDLLDESKKLHEAGKGALYEAASSEKVSMAQIHLKHVIAYIEKDGSAA